MVSWRGILVSGSAAALALAGVLIGSNARAQGAGPQLTPPPGGPVATPPPTAPPAPPAPAARRPAPKPPAPGPRPGPSKPPPPPAAPAAASPAAPATAPASAPATAPAPTGSAEALTLLKVLRTAVSKHPAIAIARTGVAAASADLRQSRAAFDTSLGASMGHTRDVFPLAPMAKQTTDTTSLEVSAIKRFGWGTSIAPQVGIDRIHARQQPSLGLPGDPVQRARVALLVRQPLLRGAGNTGAFSAVRAGQHGVRAAELSVDHAAQLQAFDATLAYWELVAAERQLALAQSSLERAQKLVDDTRTLVEADQRPRGDLRQMEGNMATRMRSVVEATNARIQRLHQLRLAMGLEARADDSWQTQDDFPVGSAPTTPAERLSELALERRRDLASAQQAVQANEAAYAGADHNTLPALDLDVSVGYAGAAFDDGVGPFFGSTADNVEGLNAGATLSLELPIENAAQQAERQRASAQLELARLTEQDLRRTTRTGVLAALDDLRMSAQALGSAREAEAQYQQARNDERDKLAAGLSTVIDVVLMEDRLIEAQLSRVRTQLSHAAALARLRMELGQLPSSEAEAASAAAALLDAEVPDVR